MGYRGERAPRARLVGRPRRAAGNLRVHEARRAAPPPLPPPPLAPEPEPQAD
jgi:hypothetical protein